jgi:hypothetical protein
VLGTFAFFVGAALFGCAAASSDGGGADDPGDPSAPGTKHDEAPRPGFDASFDSASPDGGPPEPSRDGGAGPCIDDDDPGGSENVAKALPGTTDCDDKPKNVGGVLNGPVDVDYYRLTVTDKLGCSVETDFESPTSGVELCVFVKCLNGTTTNVSGCNGGVQKTSEIGMKGCCATTPGKAIPNWDCGGITDNDSADIFVRVKQTANRCLPYTISYHF